MSLSVSKSPPVMVRPSTLTEPAKKATTQVQLSSWDRSYVGFQVTAVLIFDGPAQQRPIEAIKKGLSKALVPYSPIAGRLAPAAGAGDEDDLPLQIECTGYYGNCAVAQVAMATGAEVAGGDICDVVRLIKRAKESVPELLRREGGGAVEGMAEMGEEETAALFGYNAFMVTSWRNIGFDRADFGAGAPARVVGRWQQSTVPGCMAFLACRAAGAGEDGGEKMLTQCVRAEHAAAFLAEIDKLASYAASAPVAVATASA